MQRYLRQIILPEIGKKGQDFLSNSKVLIIGAGGLGHPAGLYLAAMGIGQIGVMDQDPIDISNLHRQVLFNDKDIGQNKADVLATKIQQQNLDIKVISYPQFLNKKIAQQIVPNYDLIIDCTDNFSAKYLINDLCLFYKKPLIYGAISQFEGQVSSFYSPFSVCYRCVFPQYPTAAIKNCSDAGVVGPLPGIIGTQQALEALKVLLFQWHLNKNNFDLNSDLQKIIKDYQGIEPLFNKILNMNFYNNEFNTFQIAKKPNCLCQNTQISYQEIADFKPTVCNTRPDSLNSHSDGLAELQDKIIIDVREAIEWNDFHLENSLHWSLSELKNSKFPNHLKEKNLFLVCKSGQRAKTAKDILTQHGFKNVTFSTKGVYEFTIR